MSHNYLLDTHAFLNRQMTAAKEMLERVAGNSSEKRFVEGRIEALKELQAYFNDTLNPKLPRRLYKQLRPDPAVTNSKSH